MAVFNPSIGPDTQERNYIGYSQGIGTNQQFKTLFDGIGDVAVGGAVAMDKQIQKNIYDEADKAVGPVRDLFGVADATRPADVNKAIPSQLQVQQERLARLKKGYEAGTITEVHYLGMLQDIVKGLRSKYPGYEMQIDDTIQKITGLTPANAIINAIQQEAAADKANKDQAANRKEAFIATNVGYLNQAMPGATAADWAEMPMAQLETAVGKIKGHEIYLETKAKDLSIAETLRTGTQRDLVNHANEVGIQAGATAVNMAVDSIPGGLKAIEAIIAKSGDGVPPDPETLGKLSQSLAQMKISVRNQVRTTLSQKPDPDNPTFSVWSRLSKDQQELALSNATAGLDDIEKNINGGNWNLVAANATIMKAITDRAGAEVLKSSKGAQALAALSAIGGPGASAAVGIWLNKNPTIYNELSRAVGMGQAASVATNGAGGSTINKDIKDGSQQDPKLIPSLLDYGVAMSSDPTVHPVLAENSIRYLFEKDGGLNLEQFYANERERVFAKLTSPVVTNRVKELSNKGSPGLWDKYRTWSKTWFSSLFNARASGYTSMPKENRDIVKVEFNPTMGQLVYKRKPTGSSGLSSSMDPAGALSIEEDMAASASAHLDNINRILATMKPIVEADGGDFSKAAQTLLENRGIIQKAKEPTANGPKDQSRVEPDEPQVQLAGNDLSPDQIRLNQMLYDRSLNPNWRDDPAYQPGGKAQSEIERLRKVIKNPNLALNDNRIPDSEVYDPSAAAGYGNQPTPPAANDNGKRVAGNTQTVKQPEGLISSAAAMNMEAMKFRSSSNIEDRRDIIEKLSPEQQGIYMALQRSGNAMVDKWLTTLKFKDWQKFMNLLGPAPVEQELSVK